MDSTLHLVRLRHYPVFKQLQLEEALLRADQRNWCILNDGSPDSIVMGISGKKEELIHPERYEEAPIPLIRRFSGGGTVVVDENTLFVSIILNHTDASSCPQSVLKWNAALYEPFLNQHGFCIQENDYALANRKFGGNAQYFCKGRWLHHSTLLWDYNPRKMDYLLLPKKRPAYRRERAHTEFLSILKEVLPEKKQVEDGLVNSLDRLFSIQEVTLEDALPILERSHRKATTWLE